MRVESEIVDMQSEILENDKEISTQAIELQRKDAQIAQKDDQIERLKRNISVSKETRVRLVKHRDEADEKILETLRENDRKNAAEVAKKQAKIAAMARKLKRLRQRSRSEGKGSDQTPSPKRQKMLWKELEEDLFLHNWWNNQISKLSLKITALLRATKTWERSLKQWFTAGNE